jgi:hypothetical protein
MSLPALETVLLNGVSSGSSKAVNVKGYRDLTIYLAGTGTLSTGTVIVEEAYYNVTGTPSSNTIVLPPTTWSSVTGISPLAVSEVSGGLQKAYQLPPGAYAFIKVSVGTSITGGGTITVALVGI